VTATGTGRPALDVSKLPAMAFGSRDPLWWAVVLLIAIEGTMLALLAIAYFYVRDRTDPFPPARIGRDVAWIAALEVLLWIASAWPQRRATKAAWHADVGGMRRNLIAATVLAAGAAAVKVWLFRRLPFAWDSHAYGSVVWGLLGVHWVHGLTAVGEDLTFIAILFVGPVEQKHRVDIEVSSLLVYFVVAGALASWAVVFLEVMLGGPR
jgi:cytochrome c oxidase subunit III